MKVKGNNCPHVISLKYPPHGGHKEALISPKSHRFHLPCITAVSRDSKSLAVSHLTSASELNASNIPLKGER